MKNTILKRTLSAFLAFVMVFLMMPISVLPIVAADSTEIKTYDDFDLLGSGYNLLGSNPLTSKNLSSKSDIFDKSFINYVAAERTTGSEASYSYTYITDMDSYLKNQSNSMTTSVSTGAKIKLFSLETKTKMGTSEKTSTSIQTATEYAVLKANKKIAYSYMNLQSHLKDMWTKNALSANFKEDIKKLDGTDEMFEAFVEKYGTHIIVGYSSGGGAMTTYKSSSFSYAFSESTEINNEVSVKTGLTGLASVEGSVVGKANEDLSLQQQAAKKTAYGYSYGADGLIEWGEKGGNFGSVNDFFEKIDYEKSEILVDSSLKLVPIWDLISACKNTDTEYADSIVENANRLKDYFNKQIELQCKDFYSKYLGEEYVSDNPSDEVEEWLAEDDLQIITNAEEFNAIRNDPEGAYILACNIDLSAYDNWIPIGTNEAPFMGKLYGNYNTVTGLKITESTDGYAGLFGYCGDTASISSLSVAGTIALPASPETYIGGIAAYNRGKIKNCFDNVVYDVTYTSIADLNIPVREIDLSAPAQKEITVGDEIGVRLVGQEGITYTGFNIVIADSKVNSPVYIILENANIVGNSINGTIYSYDDRPIYIISTGTDNSITGAENSIAVNAPYADVFVLGTGGLTINGGDGANGITHNDMYPQIGGRAPSGTNGKDGGAAIVCNTIVVNLKNAPLYLYGGNGGNGGNGSNVLSEDNFSGTPKLISGGHGGDGGNGGDAIITATNIEKDISIISCSSFYSQPGNGGNGGRGGKGCDVEESGSWQPDDGGDGGNGGNGGNGFVAGSGGDAGNGGFSYGRGTGDKIKGHTGNGGDGGDSGSPMTAYDGNGLYYMGTPGKAGAKGYAGQHDNDSSPAIVGYDGAPGKVLPAVYDESKQYGNTFIEGSNAVEFDLESATKILIGIQCGYTKNPLNKVNQTSWENNILEVRSIEKSEKINGVEYYSGDNFNRGVAKIFVDNTEINDYRYAFNSYCSDDVLDRTGYVQIERDGCKRYIPVHITKTAPIKLDIIEVKNVEFVVGTAFDIAGLSLMVTYNNGDIEYITEGEIGLTYTAPSTERKGTQTVSLSYDHDNNSLTESVAAEYDIYVVAASIESIEIRTEPDKKEYYQGESLDMSGIEVRKWMNDGTYEDLDINQLKFTVSPAICNVGTSTVTVTYANKSETFSINVLKKENFDHAWDKGTVTTLATHTTTGIMTYTCLENCGATKTEVINPIEGHSFGDWYKLTDESHQRICECGHTAERPHSWNEGEITTEATHFEKGVILFTCTDCGATKNEDIAPLKDHIFTDWTNHDDEQHSRSCECGEVEYADHSWDDGEISVEPTYTTEGLASYTCTDCSANIKKTIPVLEIPEDAPYIVVGSKNAVVGKTVTVKISLKNNPGITSIRATVTYDSSVLTLCDVKYNTAMGGQSVLPEVITDLDGSLILYWTDGLADYYADTTFATLTFAVADGAVVGDETPVSIAYEAEDIFNAEEENVHFFCEEATLVFIDYTPGDINGDGVLSSKDTTRLMRYLAGWDVEVNEAALDVNGDGTVNSKDSTRLMRYLAGWDVEIH